MTRTMKLSSFFTTFFLLLLVQYVTVVVQAWPTGAGACPGGQAATEGVSSHEVGRDTVTLGTLSDAAYMVMINGQELMHDTPMQIPLGVPVSIELVASDAASTFKGFLLRLSSSTTGVSTLDYLMVNEGDEGVVQMASPCVDVAGLTHVSNDEKTSIMATILIPGPEPDDGLILDVTVVRINSSEESLSETFYNGFTLEAVEGIAEMGGMDGDGMGMGMMTSDSSIKEQLDRIESKLDQLLELQCAGGGPGSGGPRPQGGPGGAGGGGGPGAGGAAEAITEAVGEATEAVGEAAETASETAENLAETANTATETVSSASELLGGIP